MMASLIRPALLTSSLLRRCSLVQKIRKYSHAAPSVALLDEAMFLMSMQHAHVDGPWQSMSRAVQQHFDDHHRGNSDDGQEPVPTFQVLDLACGRRGEPGTTIAHSLPRALVHCTDSSDAAVAAVQTVASSSGTTSSSSFNHRLPPPPNLVKSVADLCDLSQFASNSMHAITCCYGYNLVDETDLEKALTQAYRVLAPGGILIVVNWESSALRFIGRDVLTGVKRGGGNFWEEDNNDDLFLPPLSALDPIALSGTTDGALLFSTGLEQAGFMRNHVPIVSVGSYPFNLGRSPDIQFFMGTFTVREELLQMGALSGDDDDDSVMMAGGWSCLAEESFWTNIRKYTGTAQPLADDDDDDDDDDGTMWLHGNQYKMSIMKK